MTLCVLNQTLESRLKITLPEDMGEALANGTILCQLVNHVRPRSVSIIHIPSPAVVSLEASKQKYDAAVSSRAGSCMTRLVVVHSPVGHVTFLFKTSSL